MNDKMQNPRELAGCTGAKKITITLNFTTLTGKLERMTRMLLVTPRGLSMIELLPIGTTWASNQIKELRDWYGFTLPMQRHKYDPQNPAKWYGIFSLSDSDRVRALQLLSGAV